MARLKNIVLNMPEKPGSYQFYDKDHTIIYVGKAKRLKSRVSSYFHTEVDRFKTKVLVSKICDITYTVVNTEEDALLLENSLIKRYNPRYNVLLKDGKTYPSICITKEYLPRIFKTRTINRKGGQYFGPYSHISSMYNILDLIGKIYKPRKCHFPISAEGIAAGKYKPCLEYHIHNCGAPCCGRQSYDDYMECIRQAREILKGNTRELSELLYQQMQELSTALKFEEAEKVKQRYMLLQGFVSRSEVVSHTITDVDVFSIIDDEASRNAYINYIHVKNGTINQSFTFEYKRKLDETCEELLIDAIPEIRERFQSTAREVIVPFELSWQLSNVTFTVPQRGDKRHLLELSEMNSRQYKFDRLKQAEKLNPEQKQTRLMKELQAKLKLPKLPYHIECFDNSNIQGTNPVASCVVFRNGVPSKKDYRKFKIKTVIGANDYASMKEVVNRRYSRMLREDPDDLPQLVVIDGGKGQLDFAYQALAELGLTDKLTVIGLAKRLEEVIRVGDPYPLFIDRNSAALKVLQRIRDEAHRFGITFHRSLRSKSQIESALTRIKGVGEQTEKRLLIHYGSVPRIAAATVEDLAEFLGRRELAERIHNELNEEYDEDQ